MKHTVGTVKLITIAGYEDKNVLALSTRLASFTNSLRYSSRLPEKELSSAIHWENVLFHDLNSMMRNEQLMQYCCNRRYPAKSPCRAIRDSVPRWKPTDSSVEGMGNTDISFIPYSFVIGLRNMLNNDLRNIIKHKALRSVIIVMTIPRCVLACNFKSLHLERKSITQPEHE